MSHLSTDRLASLGDERPTPAEAEHIATCAACARERDAYAALVSIARDERAQIALPLTRWDSIAAALALDARAAAPPPRATPVTPARRTPHWPMQIAAGLLLLAGGVMLGRASVPGTIVPGGPVVVATAQQRGEGDAAPHPVTFASVADAREAQQESELRYQQAVAYLARFDSASAEGDPTAYRSRLAALDRVISTTREALREAPHDPVINGYYFSTLGQREATLQQMNTALPASLRLNSF